LVGKARRNKQALTPDDLALWEETIQEQKRGWLQGPMTEAQVTQCLGTDKWLPSRRFALLQNKKLRAIDDYSEPCINAAFGQWEKLDLQSVVFIVSILKVWLHCALKDDWFELQLSSGPLKGRVHEKWTPESLTDVLGLLIDLTKAYRQLGVKPCDQWAAVIVLPSGVDGAPSFFIQRSLPFEATGSVFGFNRCSRFLWHAACHDGDTLWSAFYDDFVVWSPRTLHESASETACAIFDKLGWAYAS
jgi:hypothetical protein